MAAPIPGSLITQSREPQDGKYWVSNSQLVTLNTGLTYQGQQRFSKSDDSLWINLSTGWKKIPLDSSSSSLTIGTVTSGNTPSATIANNKLNIVFPVVPTNQGFSVIEVNPYTCQSDGQQVIPVPSTISKVLFVLLVETDSEYTRVLDPDDYLLANNNVTISTDASARTQNRIHIYGYTGSSSSDNSNSQVVEQNNRAIITTTDLLRYITNPSVDSLYYTKDYGKEGYWAYDPSDTTRTDDSGLCIVTTNGKRFKRIFVNEINLSWFGINSTNSSSIDLSSALLSVVELLNSLNLQSRTILLNAITYRWDNYTSFNPYSFNIDCREGKAILDGKDDNGIMWITKPSNITNIIFRGTGDGNAPNKLTANQDITSYTTKSLVRCSSVSNFIGCDWLYSKGHGLYFDGNVNYKNSELPDGTNSSCSHVFNFQFISNKGAGIYIESPTIDASYTTGGVDNNEIYTAFGGAAGFANNGWGYVDESFLGCRLSYAQFNNNTFGHIRACTTHTNGRGSIKEVYEEETNQDFPSVIGGFTILEGRFNTVITQDDAVFRYGSTISKINTQSLTINYGGSGQTYKGPGNSPTIVAEIDAQLDKVYVKYRPGFNQDSFFSIFQGGVVLTSAGSANSRLSHDYSIAMKTIYTGKNFILNQYLTTINDTETNDINYNRGDTIHTNNGSWYPTYWVVQTPGKKSDNSKIVSSTQNGNLTVTVAPGSGGQPVANYNPATVLTLGQYITVGGITGRVLAFQSGNKIVIDNQFNITSSPATVTLAYPEFRAYGDMLGLKNQMPTNLGKFSTGIRYITTDEDNKEYKWVINQFV